MQSAKDVTVNTEYIKIMSVGEPGCFAKNTIVLLANGDLKRELVEKIRKGVNTKQAVVALIFAMDENDDTFKEVIKTLTKANGQKK